MLHLVWDALKRTCYCMIAFLAFLVLVPNLPPYDMQYRGMNEPQVIPFTNGLSANHRLENAEHLSRSIVDSSLGYLKGPESFAIQEDYLYTGVQGGDVLRLNINDPKKPWEFVTKIGSSFCPDLQHEEVCGRILGLNFDTNQGHLLFLADAYYGLYKVNLKTQTKTALVPSNALIDGKRNVLTNSLVLSKDSKTIYYTVSSTNFPLHNGMYEVLTKPSGRLLKYDVYGNISKVLMDDLSFANGVTLSPNEDFLLVCECGSSQIWRYWLKGDQRGQKEIFARTPGCPDNIKPSEDGKYIVGIPVVHLPNQSSLIQKIVSNPILAKVVVRLYCLLQTILEAFNTHVTYLESFAVIIHRLGNTEHSGANMVQGYGLVIEFDSEGNIVQSWHSQDPSMSKICEGFLHNGYMYLGSPYNTFAARVPYYQ